MKKIIFVKVQKKKDYNFNHMQKFRNIFNNSFE